MITNMRRVGFTIVETLVVVAIVGILAAIMTSVMLRAKDNGKTSSCAANLAQIGHALEMYTQDNDQAWPTAPMYLLLIMDVGDGPARFIASVHPYTKSDDLFHCPFDSAQRRITTRTPTSYEENYGMIAEGTRLPERRLTFSFRPSIIGNPSGCAAMFDKVLPTNPDDPIHPADRAKPYSALHGDGRGNNLYLDGHTASLPLFDDGHPSTKGECFKD